MTDHKSTPALAPDDLARACAERMWADDPASRGLGMTMEEIGAGRATLAMQVGDSMVNGHGMCHGGFIFTLADSAFAFACNTYDRRTVAQHAAITFVAPAARATGWWQRRWSASAGDVPASLMLQSPPVPG